MRQTYRYPKFDYARPAALDASAPERRPVVVVGGGPVGLAAAIDCRVQGLPVLLLDEDDTVSFGSRGVCYARRALEVLDRLGAGEAVAAKGVQWDVGRTFVGDGEVYRFNLSPDPGRGRPGMVNLQQYYLEDFLVTRAREAGVEMRWKNKVVAVTPRDHHVELQVETPDGTYTLEADWLLAADGAKSPLRRMMGLEVEGRVFQDRFLIADVVMKADFPAERWFWFDPPFHRGQSVLLHKQADNVWRIDFQLGWDADPEEEKKPERVLPRIRAMLGDEREFELEWVSVYTFQCRRMASFRHGRVLFAGDSAHQVSPFGARGANSGLQDTDNLVWKLKLVIDGLAPRALLDSYSHERGMAADENIMNSTRSTDFITPKSAASRVFRDAALALARRHPFARRLVNSGRLSVPSFLLDSPLNTPDGHSFDGDMLPGAPMEDAPVRHRGQDGWLLRHVGNRFCGLCFVEDAAAVDAQRRAAFLALGADPIPVEVMLVTTRAGAEVAGLTVLHDTEGLAAARYDARQGSFYLIRPDQHVAARWWSFDPLRVRAAVARATGNAQGGA
jgi:3-(3-hydroxy-phenyl)propionate hydroxylase